MHIKICGVTRPEHVEAASATGASLIGLMFAERSRRRVTVEEAKRLMAALPARSEPVESLRLTGGGLWFDRCAAALDALIGERGPLVVGVFANQPATLVNSIAEAVGLDLVQLSGDEPWETCLRLRRPAIKALRPVNGCSSARELMRSAEAGTASLCMLDADVPGEYGGTGQRADWGVAGEVARALPLMLAGGLTPGNVGEAVAAVRPWAVDVSSGVERDGVKDVALIEEFVRAAGRAAAEVGSDGG